MDQEWSIPRRQLVILAIIFEGGLGVVALLAGWWMGIEILQSITWDISGIVRGSAAAVPMLVFFALCLLCPVRYLASIRDFTDKVIRPLFRPCSLLDLALICTVAGLGEEMLFRGLLQPFFERHLETWAALGLTSVLFGLAHPLTPSYTVLAAIVGAYLGWVFLVSGNLLTVIVAHGVYDFVALVVLTRTGRDGESSISK